LKVLHYLGIGRLPTRPMADATGGTERVALEIARIQARRGHDVTIAWMGDQAWQGTWQGVRLVHLAPYAVSGRRFGRHLRLASLIRFGRFDIVHLHEYTRTSFFARPSVMHFHNNPLYNPEHDNLAGEAPQYWARVGRSRAQIAVSDFVNRRLRRVHREAGPGALPEHIVTNYSGVAARPDAPQDAAEQRARVRRELGVGDTDVLFLFAGAVRPEKGVDYLARAFARLASENARVCLAIAGGSRLWVEAGWLDASGPQGTEQQVRTILQPEIARQRAFILGIISPAEIGAYYAAADVFVLPSMFQETFGLVVLEAFAAGLPVIAFRSGGVPELVEDGHNGILVDQGDEEALLGSMRDVMLDGDLRARLGAEARRTAARFPWEATVDRLEEIYDGVLKRGRDPPGLAGRS
jgi:glycosyltransferase involved in cell wall biosynthesis